MTPSRTPPASPAQPGDFPAPRQVLLIRPSALGDVVRTVPALVTLRHAFPDAHLDWLVNDGYVDAIRAHPALTGVIPFARQRYARMLTRPAALRDFLRFSQELRRRRYDLVVDLQGLFRSGFLTWITRAPQRWGFADARELAHRAYTRRVAAARDQHTVERMLAVLADAGLPPQRDARLYVPAEHLAWRERFLAQRGGVDSPYVLIAPTAQWRCKCWPLPKVTEIARRLLREGRSGGRLFVLAAPSEKAYVAPLLESLRGLGRVELPATNVGQMLALIAGCRLILCNDSGPLHAAVGFARPIVTTFGPTLPRLVGPYQREDAVVAVPGVTEALAASFRRRKEDQSLIDRIDVEAVWAKVQAQLDRPRDAAGGVPLAEPPA